MFLGVCVAVGHRTGVDTVLTDTDICLGITIMTQITIFT